MRKINKILLIGMMIILLLGTIVIVKKDFNYGMDYKGVTELKFMLGQVLDMNEVEGIVKEVFADKEVKIEKINYFNDSINISVVKPSDEEIKTLIDKFNERYEQSNTMESVSRVNVPTTPLSEIVAPYMLPCLIALVLVLAYMVIRFNKKFNLVKTVVLPTTIVLFVEMIFFVVYAILQIPITILTMPLAMLILVVTLTTIVAKYEKNM